MNKFISDKSSKKPIYYLFIIIIAIFIIFGFLKPFFSLSSTSYLFGMIEKKPDAQELLKKAIDPDYAKELTFVSCTEKTSVNDAIGYYCNFAQMYPEDKSYIKTKYRLSIQIINNEYQVFNFRDVGSFK